MLAYLDVDRRLNAVLLPVRVTGEVIVASTAGAVTWMLGVDEPITDPIRLIRADGRARWSPVRWSLGCTGTSPERLSPCSNAPTTGFTKPT